MKPHQFLGYRYGRIGIVAIPVCTYFIGKSLAYRSAAYHYFYLMTDTGCFQSVDHLLHISHGCCQQGAHAQDVCLVLLDFFHKFVARYIYAYVDYLKAATFQHGSHQVLADIMQVAFHGPDDYLAYGGRGTPLQ